ncbi:hypothetical protein [Janthinobacterium sp. HLX7-2]|uniref:hypothetical protein n=1 Tax=Janthinobacterium sp. HLX7-2 TaxID=1259331 RepID=UPI003F293BA2
MTSNSKDKNSTPSTKQQPGNQQSGSKQSDTQQAGSKQSGSAKGGSEQSGVGSGSHGGAHEKHMETGRQSHKKDDKS